MTHICTACWFPWLPQKKVYVWVVMLGFRSTQWVINWGTLIRIISLKQVTRDSNIISILSTYSESDVHLYICIAPKEVCLNSCAKFQISLVGSLIYIFWYPAFDCLSVCLSFRLIQYQWPTPCTHDRWPFLVTLTYTMIRKTTDVLLCYITIVTSCFYFSLLFYMYVYMSVCRTNWLL